MSDDQRFCYVAADPNQPGSAWALSIDEPGYEKEISQSISEWFNKGAIVLRVPIKEAKEMLLKWDRPKNNGKGELL